MTALGSCVLAPDAYAQAVGGTPTVDSGIGHFEADNTKSSGSSAIASEMLGARKPDPNAKMLVTADELVYDYRNDEVSAVGNVQIYYDGAVLQANRVVYERGNKKLRAEGNVRLKDRDGKIITADNLNLSEDFTTGFVNSLRIDTPDKMHFVAAQAERSGGDTTTLTNGAYTPCEPCKENPQRPPLWQVKAQKIIHKEKEQMIYFQNATFEFLGIPIAWAPYMEAPDPSVKRKSGFLIPQFISTSEIGTGMTIPYFWNIAPNMDVTFSPLITSKQGVMFDAEFRHRLDTGVYSIRAAGIRQQDKGAFWDTNSGQPDPTPGYRDDRGLVETHGQFNINKQWYWGWDGYLMSDQTFMQDYDLVNTNVKDVTSQIYLVGQGDRSYFDARVQYFQGLTEYDDQDQMPVVHPVIDYSKVLNQSVFGGQFSYDFNLISLTREEADLRATSAAFVVGWPINGATNECNLALATNPSKDCLMRGMAGTYTRLSGEANWKRTLIDDAGQMWTPFVNLRVDVASVEPTQADIPWLYGNNESLIRAMPAMGLEYRYPFISVHNWGTQTIEPIAQIIVRPDETDIGKFPNEDAQSLVFDDTNLFSISKYSGYDRVEGGTRANVGVQYTADLNRSGIVNALFGQSYHLAGKNSFAYYDMANTGAESGLETDTSDYVARLYYAPNKDLSLTSRFRFDNDDMSVQRFEVEGRTTINKLTLNAIYGMYEPQPELGYYDRREGVYGSGTYKINDRWAVQGGARYNLEADEIDYTMLGVSYIDDCFGISLAYVADYTESGNRERVDKFLLTISLRTLGQAGFSTKLDNSE
ncbi:LPS-assembly protein LptD [Bosea sp. 117]|uniref:LPS-assembly protein LptD n=1 Tax=Bosea sp. 117 TaxID=1125973 RepID=UPI0020BE3239|nr:LPS-assembly protein LptD [Bosea sp. 117]